MSTSFGGAYSGSETFAGPGYASRERVGAYLQVEASDLAVDDQTTDADGKTDWDYLIEALQAKAKAQIDAFCHRDFEPYTAATITLNGGHHSRVLRLPNPVRAVTEVREAGTALEESAFAWQPDGSLIKLSDSSSSRPAVYGAGTPVGLHSKRQPVWNPGYGNIEVDLDYGYQEGQAPEPIQQAEIMLVDHSLVGLIQKRESPIVQSDDYQIDANIPISLTDEIRELIRPYQRTEMGV